jgi:predicted small secreted protein
MMKKIMLCTLLWGLAMVLAGCEKDGVLEGSGEKVTVNILLGDVVYTGSETVTRGYRSEAEAVRVPLGDGVFMFATLEEDLEAPTRAGIPLEEGIKVRIVAYNETTSGELIHRLIRRRR